MKKTKPQIKALYNALALLPLECEYEFEVYPKVFIHATAKFDRPDDLSCEVVPYDWNYDLSVRGDGKLQRLLESLNAYGGVIDNFWEEIEKVEPKHLNPYTGKFNKLVGAWNDYNGDFNVWDDYNELISFEEFEKMIKASTVAHPTPKVAHPTPKVVKIKLTDDYDAQVTNTKLYVSVGCQRVPIQAVRDIIETFDKLHPN